VSDEPLIPGPLYGLRTWQVTAEDGVERLAAPHRGIAWPPGDWLTATCERHAGPAPAPDCDCGIHAWHPRRASARQVLATRREVPGVVEAEGATEVHEDGFRAERARPYALVLAPGRNAEQVRRLAREYDVEVAEVGGPRELVAWCQERGLGLSEAVVRDLVGPVKRRKSGALKLVGALAVAGALVFAGLQLIPEPESGHKLKGRSGEIRTP
jgi:hypothetical protein